MRRCWHGAAQRERRFHSAVSAAALPQRRVHSTALLFGWPIGAGVVEQVFDGLVDVIGRGGSTAKAGQ